MSAILQYVTSLAVFSDGRMVSGSEDNTIKVWDLLQEKCVMTLEGHTEVSVTACSYNIQCVNWLYVCYSKESVVSSCVA